MRRFTPDELELCRKSLLYMSKGLDLALNKDLIQTQSEKERAAKDSNLMRELSSAIMDSEVA